MTIVRPPARWGYVKIKNNYVIKFEEKNQLNEGWINGGFFVFDYKIFDYIKKGDNTILEIDVLPKLALIKQLKCFKHKSFWQCMDNIRDKKYLNYLWKKKSPPWRFPN
jgi:glucose-1-phosphate cytidylyltransferase